MRLVGRGCAVLTILALAVAVSGCSAVEAETSAAPAEVSHELTVVEPTTPQDEAFLEAFEDSGGPPGYSGWTTLSVDEIPDELIPTETLGGDLLAAAIQHTDGGSGESTPGAPPYVKLLFEGGLFVQATADRSARPDASILADHAQQMATQSEYSQVQTETVANTLGIVTVGQLPSQWFGTWAVQQGAAVEWADQEWYYNVWVVDSQDVEPALAVARSLGQ